MMTQKDFEALAAALYEAQAREVVIEAVAAVCARSNPKFNRARFRSLAIIDARSPEAKRREVLRGMADEHFSESEGLEIDGDAAISEGDDNGAYVAAWLWVDFNGTKFCKGENGSHEDCSEGCPTFDQAAKEAFNMLTQNETVIFKGKRYVGIDRDGLPVFVEIEYTRRDGKNRLSICGHAQGKFDHAYSGQITGAIKKREGWRKLAAPAGALDRLAEIWDRWHLNDMSAACEHQRAAGWLVKAREEVTLYHWRMTTAAMEKQCEAEAAAKKALHEGRAFTPTRTQTRYASMPFEIITTHENPSARTLEYEPARPLYAGGQDFKEVKALGWLEQSEHPDGILSRPCPECGYKYGSAWQYQAVPDDVISWLRAFVTEDGAHPTPKAPPSFCEANHITAVCERASDNPSMSDDGRDPGARHWRVTLERSKSANERPPLARLRVPFTQGSAHKKAPTAQDVLSCLILDAQSFENVRGFEEWAQEYAGEMDTPKARKAARRTYDAVEEQSEKLREFLGHELFTMAMEGR